jgi:hypothetical protein
VNPLSRFLFFLLLIANAGFGAHIYLGAAGEGQRDWKSREKNADDLKIVSVIDATTATRAQLDSKTAAMALAGAACIELSSVAPAEQVRVREAFTAMNLGPRLIERRVEEISRYWVYLPPARDRKAAEASVAALKKQGVTDISIRPDNSVSLGVFSSEDAAQRFLAQVEGKGVKGSVMGPFSKETRDVLYLVREPDTELVAKLVVLSREYQGSRLRPVACPVAEVSAAPPKS